MGSFLAAKRRKTRKRELQQGGGQMGTEVVCSTGGRRGNGEAFLRRMVAEGTDIFHSAPSQHGREIRARLSEEDAIH